MYTYFWLPDVIIKNNSLFKLLHFEEGAKIDSRINDWILYKILGQGTEKLYKLLNYKNYYFFLSRIKQFNAYLLIVSSLPVSIMYRTKTNP